MGLGQQGGGAPRAWRAALAKRRLPFARDSDWAAQDCLPNAPKSQLVTRCRHALEAPGPTDSSRPKVSWRSCWRSGPRAAISSLTVLPGPTELALGAHAHPKEHSGGRGACKLSTRNHKLTEDTASLGGRVQLQCACEVRGQRSDCAQQQGSTWAPLSVTEEGLVT